MGIFEEIQQRQAEGRSDQEIIQILNQEGYSQRDIAEAISQTQIKEAVAGSGSGQMPQQEYAQQYPQPPQQQPQQQDYSYYPQQQDQAGYGQQSYDSYNSAGLSADTISEVAEQTVLEKLSPLRKRLEEVMDLKTTMEAKLSYLDERLLRIERVIDRLQLSILQKVGSFAANVEDIKKEMQETNKTFKAITEKHTHHQHKN